MLLRRPTRRDRSAAPATSRTGSRALPGRAVVVALAATVLTAAPAAAAPDRKDLAAPGLGLTVGTQVRLLGSEARVDLDAHAGTGRPAAPGSGGQHRGDHSGHTTSGDHGRENAPGQDRRDDAHAEHEPADRGHRGEGELHAEESPREREERLIALAAGWVVDPALVTAQKGDSKATRQARSELAELAGQMDDAVSGYADAADQARHAQRDARRAQLDLAAAQVASAQAGATYVRAQTALADMVRGQYTDGDVDTVTLLIDPDSEEALRDLSLLDLVGDRQDEVATAAADAAAVLEASTRRVEAADREARAKVEDAHTALRAAATVRHDVVADIETARKLLEKAADRDADRAAAAGSAGPGVYIRPKGKVSFPLPPGAVFVNQDNWGNSGSQWSSMHTGDDLSTACGTPVLAATDGVIEIRTDQSWSGPWLVMVTTGTGKLATWYAHMEALNVTDGQKVKAGQQIGSVGTQGNSSGCHLHFEYHPFGGSIYEDSTDPVAWWRTLGVLPGA